MAIIKCKICGGDIELTADKTFGTCEYCGNTMTLPRVDDDQRAAAFNRGNHFRRIGEFDKALAVYERIVREDDTDAEAHWCCALCRFGIEYVEDPATYEWLPTCHRASFDSFLEDVDYLAAVEHSEGITKRQYQKDAAKIAEVQRGILATSQNEEPFDVFICYKETDSNGDRTHDSMMAQDVYYQLTDHGYRVFFSRITLEDMAGKQYEPYIFAALNSAKVMVVIGTQPEHLNAVWVKNEWSRFLAMMKKDRNKVLLPCYRDMDPYNMPEQLSVLQSYDMAKIGFIQDLIRGIAKVLDAKSKPMPVQETVIVQQPAVVANVAPLLKRAFMFLEDGDWNSANEYCEKVLDLNPECAEAYVGKLMVELQVKRQESLKNLAEPFDGSSNYQKALRFGDDKLSTVLKGYIENINTRNENARKDSIYRQAKSKMSASRTEDRYKEAARLFASINEYMDAAALAQECNEKAETARKDAIHSKAMATATGERIEPYKQAIKLFESIPGWKDADEQLAKCQKIIENLQAKAEADRLERERLAEIARKRAKERARRNKKIAIIATPIICVIAAFIFILNAVIIPNVKYNNAVALLDAGKYDEAIVAFKALDGYKDSANMIIECKYGDAIALMEAEKYLEAISAFEALGGYKNSTDMITECQYNNAIALMKAEQYPEAIVLFKALGNYRDSADQEKTAMQQYLGDEVLNAKVGDYFFFGAYEQDNNISNGKEAIEWLVLAVEDGKVLIISKHALDCRPYNDKSESVTWATCTLRTWLNNYFLNSAFSDLEEELIPTVKVSASAAKNSMYPSNPGNTTQDKIFLLSSSEAMQYLNSVEARKCVPTDYAIANGARTNQTGGYCWWWLRTPGTDQKHTVSVRDAGTIDMFGHTVNYDVTTVRPVLWIDLSKIS